MKLTNTRQRNYNGVRFGETVEVTDKDQIADYLENGFEKAGKEAVNTLAPGGDAGGDNAPKEKALDKMNKTELIEAGAKLGITLDPLTKNDDMIAAITAKQAELANAQ